MEDKIYFCTTNSYFVQIDIQATNSSKQKNTTPKHLPLYVKTNSIYISLLIKFVAGKVSNLSSIHIGTCNFWHILEKFYRHLYFFANS